MDGGKSGFGGDRKEQTRELLIAEDAENRRRVRGKNRELSGNATKAFDCEVR